MYICTAVDAVQYSKIMGGGLWCSLEKQGNREFSILYSDECSGYSELPLIQPCLGQKKVAGSQGYLVNPAALKRD